MNHLRVVLQVLKEHVLFAKYSKCLIWLRSLPFLGHIISSEGVEVDPRKTAVVKNLFRTLTPMNINSFLGLATYYKRYVDRIASLASPLIKLTQRNVKFLWSNACGVSFQI